MTRVYTRPPANQPVRQCAGCGTALPSMKHQGRPRKWCSPACRLWAYNHAGVGARPDGTTKGRPRTRPDALNCQWCSQPFKPWSLAAKFCSRRCVGASQAAKAAAERAAKPTVEQISECSNEGCERPRLKRGRICGHCLRASEDPERVKARQRRKTHRRKMRTRRSDLPLEEEIRLRVAAKRCPLCRTRLVDEPYLPASKELDHIVPLNQGGAHSIWNVRIICRACNLRRPKDGSDAVQVPLFALEVA